MAGEKGRPRVNTPEPMPPLERPEETGDMTLKEIIESNPAIPVSVETQQNAIIKELDETINRVRTRTREIKKSNPPKKK